MYKILDYFTGRSDWDGGRFEEKCILNRQNVDWFPMDVIRHKYIIHFYTFPTLK